MRIAIYGVSAAGKDHLISDLVEYLAERGVGLTHVPGSATLDGMARRICGKSFSSLGEDDKARLRRRFADELAIREQECGNVVVDGHYAFYASDGSLADVFTDSDLAAYDLFLYLDTDPEVVTERLCRQGRPMPEDDVRAWQGHEVEGLGARLLEAGMELHVIRDDGEPTLRYIEEAMRGKWSSPRIAREAVEALRTLGGPGVVCLVDCDKTLVEEDTTSLVLGRHGTSASGLVDVYVRDRYTNYQCFMADRWLGSNLCLGDDDVAWACEEATPNEGLIASLRDRPSVPVVAITAGPTDVWSKLIDRLGIGAELLDTHGVMSKYVKCFVARELQRRGFYVIAVGDSMLDSLMLEQADRPYAYAGKGRRESMARLLERNPRIRQFSFCPYQYPGTHADESICWVDCLSQKDREVASDIAVCKSSSGSMGRVLRGAHRRLGARLGRRISTCLACDEFAVVIMMRSGLPLGEGIADELDCPMLFFDGDADGLVEQVEGNGLGGRSLILTDGVVNTGRSLEELAARLEGYRIAVAASVVSSSARIGAGYPVFTARVSDNSYVGAKQWDVSGGKGPDTADRLFRTM